MWKASFKDNLGPYKRMFRKCSDDRYAKRAISGGILNTCNVDNFSQTRLLFQYLLSPVGGGGGVIKSKKNVHNIKLTLLGKNVEDNKKFNIK